MLTGEAIRAARALARREQRQLASESGLSLETIKRLESIRGTVNANVRSLMAITETLRAWGVSVEQEPDGRVCVSYAPNAQAPRRASPLAPQREPAEIYRVIYYSTATAATLVRLDAVLDDILSTALGRNASLNVSGALLALDGRFLQALEGEKAAVLEIFGAIATDGRHSGVHILESRRVGGRMFAKWAMCSRQARPREADGLVPKGQPFAPETLSANGALDLLLLLAGSEESALQVG